MPTFKDHDGREWNVEFDVTAAKAIRQQCSIDLLKLDDQNVLFRLATDVELLVDVLHIICGDRCREKNIDAVSFAKALKGDAIERATAALMESIIDFFPSGRRQALKKAWDKATELDQRMVQKAMTLLDSPKMDELMETEMAKLSAQLGS